MTPSEYLDATKAKIGVQSDYELAKRMGISRGNIPGIRDGSRAIPLDVAFKLAIALELDPATVVADLEQQREKNPARKGFWMGFMSRAALGLIVACTLALSCIGISGEERGIAGGNAALVAAATWAIFLWSRKTHNLYYVKLLRCVIGCHNKAL